jgi:hypothetical protein
MKFEARDGKLHYIVWCGGDNSWRAKMNDVMIGEKFPSLEAVMSYVEHGMNFDRETGEIL